MSRRGVTMGGPARLATLYLSDNFSTARRKMGRQSASIGLVDGLIRTESQDHFHVVAAPADPLEELRASLARRRPELQLRRHALLDPQPYQDIDALLVSDPLLGRTAQWRQWQGQGPASYSLIGLTHTLCSLPVLEGLRDLATAPVQTWDALICTSRCAKAAVETSLAWQEEALRRRFQAADLTIPRPQLPVIPLGCDHERLAALGSSREQARQALRVRPDQVVLLFVGRLEIHAKAHPGVMLQALQRVASRRDKGSHPLRLLIYGTHPTPEQQQALEQACQHFARGFEVQLLDGHDLSAGDQAWAAADLFISMADNLQETFGLTPVEAMACGLPVIASDWNGYRDTVVHRSTGLLIPTWQPQQGFDSWLAGYALDQIDYDAYICGLMREVVVDEDALVAAIEDLVDDPERRRRMGEAGRERAARLFNWPSIASRIRALAAELVQQRLEAAGAQVARDCTLPLPSPGLQFKTWPSHHLEAHCRFSADPHRARERWQELQQLTIYRFPAQLSCSEGAIEALLSHAERHDAPAATTPFALAAVVNAHPELTESELAKAAHWLCKLGIFRVIP